MIHFSLGVKGEMGIINENDQYSLLVNIRTLWEAVNKSREMLIFGMSAPFLPPQIMTVHFSHGSEGFFFFVSYSYNFPSDCYTPPRLMPSGRDAISHPLIAAKLIKRTQRSDGWTPLSRLRLEQNVYDSLSASASALLICRAVKAAQAPEHNRWTIAEVTI